MWPLGIIVAPSCLNDNIGLGEAVDDFTVEQIIAKLGVEAFTIADITEDSQMENNANLDLPYIMPSQAQKHVTHNEVLKLLDALVQCVVAGRTLASAPPEPQEDARGIVPPGADGKWAGRDGAIAMWRDGGWRFLVPKEGWVAWVLDEHAFVSWTGAAWQKVTAELPPLQNLGLLGVDTEADAANPFSARLNKALCTARATAATATCATPWNKEGAASVLSLWIQSNWSGRAEIGLVGGDDLTIKVSTDGSAWKEALRIDRPSGRVTLPYTNTLRDAVFNLLPDSGRFAGSSAKDLAIGAFSFPSYLTISNGTTAATAESSSTTIPTTAARQARCRRQSKTLSILSATPAAVVMVRSSTLHR